MGAIRNIVITVTVISVLTFVALFGQLPALRRTPIGWLHRLLRHRIPSGLARIDDYVTGGKIAAAGRRLGNYLFHQKNPVVLIIYLVLLTGSAVLFIWYAIPQLPARLAIPIPLLIVQPYIFTWLCATHEAHHITTSTHSPRLHDYPYDHVLFQPNQICRTCHLAKPARSKHCSFCGVCIAMCDHHCPWINNCVGRGNYRYFLALLLALGAVEAYGAYLSWWILQPHLKTNPAHPTFSHAHFNDLLRAATIAVNTGGLSIAGVGMLAAATGALPLGLFAYHCYLIWAGMTTNESQKWADWRDDMKDGCVYKASRKALQAHHSVSKHDDHVAGLATESNGAATAFPSSGQSEPYVSWPISSDQVLAYSEDSRPPPGQEALWTRVWKLQDVDNIYDLGGWGNFMEMLKGR